MVDLENTRKRKRKESIKYRDGVGRTLKKVPWKRLVADATLELVPKGASFAVSCVGLFGAGEVAGKATKRVLEYTLRRFTHVYEEGEVRLTEVLGRTIPDNRYQGVGEFWARVMGDKLEQNALIEILGLLSPYGPLMPAHPMSRPGYTVEGWERIGDLGAEDTEDYDTRDGIIYGDRVIRLATTRNGKFFAGLYDPYYGISNVAIPLYVDQGIVKSRKTGLKELWKQPMTGGRIVRLKGRLKQIPNFYSQFVEQVPSQYRSLPSYGLEVFEIKELAGAGGVTHMAVSVGWEKRNEERLLTHYFNVQDRKQFESAEALLDDGRNNHSKSLLFNYDDLACYSPRWRHRIPKYNDMLKPWLTGENLH